MLSGEPASVPRRTGFLFWACLFHDQCAAIDCLTVETADGGCRLIRRAHLNEGDAPGAACGGVHDDLGRDHYAEFAEAREELVVGC